MEYEYQSSFVRDAKKLPKNVKEGLVEIIDNIQNKLLILKALQKWLGIVTHTELR